MILAHEVLNAVLTARAAVVLSVPPAPTGGAPALRISAIPRNAPALRVAAIPRNAPALAAIPRAPAIPPGAPTLRLVAPAAAPVGAPAPAV